jgi:phosphoglycolate phosphatase-like HAD superfamily hydrolase
VELFPDVRRVLDQLRAFGVGLSVVSGTWAGLEVVFRSLDIEQDFAGACSDIRKPAVAQLAVAAATAPA